MFFRFAFHPHHRAFAAHMCAHHTGYGARHGLHRSRGPKMFDAGALRYLVLHLIGEQPRHGYEIIKAIEDKVGGDYSPSPGVIYPLLAMLEDLGHAAVAADGNKKLYTITPEGKAFLEENRAFVDAILARMASSERSRKGSGIREALHALKGAVVERARGEALSEAQLEKIRAALQQAADEIRKA